MNTCIKCGCELIGSQSSDPCEKCAPVCGTRRADWRQGVSDSTARSGEGRAEALYSKRINGHLRTDHAGEVGAVLIYKAMLATSKDPSVIAFAQKHLATESEHLEEIQRVLAKKDQSKLLPAWKVAGWLTGALPALAGPWAVYATVKAVETFVDQHYEEQIKEIDNLDPRGKDKALQELKEVLKACQHDEKEHRHEAAELLEAELDKRLGSKSWAPKAALFVWQGLVQVGSKAAVEISRRV